MKLVLFDIDGTILSTAGAGRRAIHQAIVDHFGPEYAVDGVRFDGKTDPQIVRELLRRAGSLAEISSELMADVCNRYLEHLEVELRVTRDRVTVFPGVSELLARFSLRADCVVGLLTGNLERGAFLKLESAGLELSQFRVGAYGSDADDRPDLPAIAAARASSVMGRVPTNEDVVILGDTPADVTCGRGIGARAIAVATGSYPKEALEAAGAFAVFDDLVSVSEVEGVIFT